MSDEAVREWLKERAEAEKKCAGCSYKDPQDASTHTCHSNNTTTEVSVSSMSSMAMATIQTDRNWKRVDKLNDIPLVGGERLIVMWPDATLEQIDVVLEQRTERVMEQGGHFDMPVSTAYVLRQYRGIPVRVNLRGLQAQRVAAEPGGWTA